MKDVYLTLVSDVTSDYSGNVANKFKMKLNLRLPGEGWKVSIQSAILPRMALFKSLQGINSFNLIEMRYKVDGVVAEQKIGFAGADINSLESHFCCTSGVDFMNNVMRTLEERKQFQIPSGKKILDAQNIKMEWKREGGEPELVLHHSDPSTTILILRTLADAMQWLNKQNYNDGHLGLNLVLSYPSNTREKSEVSGNVPASLDATWLHLSSKVDWRFINLNHAFAKANSLHKRSLSVSAKVIANKETVTQSLGQVYYAPEGRVRYLFTPPVEEFQEVQTEHWEEVEISLKELDGNLVNFQSSSQCLIRLHFKKD